jgi:hypothetical protein
MNDDDRDELADLIGLIDREQEALERLASEDPVGMVMFGEAYVMDDDGQPPVVDPDAWLDSHLHGKPLK